MLQRILKATAISVIATLLAWAGISEFSEIASLAPEEYTVDFRFSDFYNIVANDRPVSTAEQRVVVVSVDSLTRNGIASVLIDIHAARPAAIGLDIAFWETTDSLDEALDAIGGRLVLPVNVVDADPDGIGQAIELLYDRPARLGAVNIEGSSTSDLVRHFWPRYAVTGDTIQSMAVALASIVEPDAVERLYRRGTASESIYYPSTSILILSHSDVPYCHDLLAGNIVIVGKLLDPLDCHKTPVDAAMPGALIHAYATTTILSDNYLTEPPQYVTWLIALGLSFAMLLFRATLPSALDNLVMRVIQTGLLIGIILAGCQAFVRWNIVIDFVPPLAAVALGMAVSDILDGLSFIVPYMLRRMRRLVQTLRHTIKPQQQ